MREYKFRGKREDANVWVYGYVLKTHKSNPQFDETTWIFNEDGKFKVELETVGQYIGMKDKNGVEIYSGEVVSFIKTYNNKRYVGEVKYIPVVAGYMLCAMNKESWHSFEFGLGTVELEIIGNIHELGELNERD